MKQVSTYSRPEYIKEKPIGFVMIDYRPNLEEDEINAVLRR